MFYYIKQVIGARVDLKRCLKAEFQERVLMRTRPCKRSFICFCRNALPRRPPCRQGCAAPRSNPFLRYHHILMFALCGNLGETMEVFNALNPLTNHAWSLGVASSWPLLTWVIVMVSPNSSHFLLLSKRAQSSHTFSKVKREKYRPMDCDGCSILHG